MAYYGTYTRKRSYEPGGASFELHNLFFNNISIKNHLYNIEKVATIDNNNCN